MEKTNLLTLVVTLTVGIILAGSLLMPVLDDATTTERTFSNEGVAKIEMKEFEVGDTWTRNSSTYEWSLNGEVVSTINEGAFNAFLTETLSGRSNGQMRGATVSGNVGGVQGVVVDETTLTLSGSGIQGTATQTYSKGFGVTDSGDYVMTKYLADRSGAYILEDSLIYATGVTAGSTVVNTVCHIEGTVKDGITVTINPMYGSSANRTISYDNVVLDVEQVPGYVGLYKFNKVTFDITETNTETEATETVTATYSAVVLPKEVTAELSQHLTPGEIALMNALPILIIIGLVLAAVGAIFIRNRD